MAMTKAEKQVVADLERELRLARAFRPSDPVEADVPRPTNFNEVKYGWTYAICYENVKVMKVTSDSGAHYTGEWRPRDYKGGWSQGGRDLYSTAERAARAGRYELYRKCMEALADADALIEAAKGYTDGDASRQRPRA